MAPFASFRLTGRNEAGRRAAAGAQAQADKRAGFTGYEPQYIKSEPQLISLSVARYCVIGICFAAARESAAGAVGPALF